MKSLENRSLRSRATGIALIAGLALGGCGTADKQKDKLARHTQSAQEVAQPVQDPLLVSLNKYRDGVFKRHRAEIFLGTCVAWANQSEGLTVTLNPGVATIGSGENKEHYFVFGGIDRSKTPATFMPMNGPAVGDEQVLTLAFKPANIKDGLTRKLSHHLTHEDNGAVYYKDEQSGMPVMDTVLAQGPQSVERVVEVCNALREHKPIPTTSGGPAA